MLRKVDSPTACPYKIPPLPNLEKVNKSLNRRDLWNAFEFFRIEALLRSKVVWKLYTEAVRLTRRETAPPTERNAQMFIFLYGDNLLKLSGEADAPMRRLLCDESIRDRFAIDDGWAVLLGSHHRLLFPSTSLSPMWMGDGILDLSAMVRSTDYTFKPEYLK
jgi:hypothetical protein